MFLLKILFFFVASINRFFFFFFFFFFFLHIFFISPSPLPQGFAAEPIKDPVTKKKNLFRWRIKIPGPAGSPFERGVYQARLVFPADYPFTPPQCWFPYSFPHPNIFPNGAVCLDLLSDKRWSPDLGIAEVLLAVQALIGAPNKRDPSNGPAVQMFHYDPPAYERTAREFAEQHPRNAPWAITE
jgi:ubiquitin-protein ligase